MGSHFNLIKAEFDASKKYQLRKTESGILELSLENVALVEAMIANDSDYLLSGDVSAGPHDDKYLESAARYWLDGKGQNVESDGGYKGSTAYWMTRLQKTLLSQHSERELKEIILFTILAVDRDNSTHITSDLIGPQIITDRIYSHQKTLIHELRDRKLGYKLIEDLAKRTSLEKLIEKNNKIYYPRENYSFATKFCHYACLYMFDGEEQDNYSIFDNVVKASLPDYLSAANIYKDNGKPYKESDFKNVSSYPLFSELIDLLRQDKISRNGFDHLLWYYNKGRIKNQ